MDANNGHNHGLGEDSSASTAIPNSLKLSSTLPLRKVSTDTWTSLTLTELKELVKKTTNGTFEIHPDVDETEFQRCKDNTAGKGPSKLQLRFKRGENTEKAYVFHVMSGNTKMLSEDDLKSRNKESRQNNLLLSCRDKEKVAIDQLSNLIGIQFTPTSSEGDKCDCVALIPTMAGEKKSMGFQFKMASANAESGQIHISTTMNQTIEYLVHGMTVFVIILVNNSNNSDGDGSSIFERYEY